VGLCFCLRFSLGVGLALVLHGRFLLGLGNGLATVWLRCLWGKFWEGLDRDILVPGLSKERNGIELVAALAFLLLQVLLSVDDVLVIRQVVRVLNDLFFVFWVAVSGFITIVRIVCWVRSHIDCSLQLSLVFDFLLLGLDFLNSLYLFLRLRILSSTLFHLWCPRTMYCLLFLDVLFSILHVLVKWLSSFVL